MLVYKIKNKKRNHRLYENNSKLVKAKILTKNLIIVWKKVKKYIFKYNAKLSRKFKSFDIQSNRYNDCEVKNVFK